MSWGIAFFEYCLMVPGNRLGYTSGWNTFHLKMIQEVITALTTGADRLGLVATGSSDFHGTHKTVRLGAFTTEPEVYEKIAAAATGVPVL